MTKRLTDWITAGCALAAVGLIPLAAQGRSQKSQSPPPAKRVQQAAAGQTYVIGPGDVLDISVWGNDALSFRGLPVRPDGKISVPLLNDVQASGLTAMQLAASITTRLKSYVKDPQVTVVVTAVNSQRYYILGEVAHPGLFPLLPGLTALQAISTAGGFTEFANEKKIYILRQRGGRTVKLPFNYKMVVQGKDLKENVVLKPSDTIVVP